MTYALLNRSSRNSAVFIRDVRGSATWTALLRLTTAKGTLFYGYEVDVVDRGEERSGQATIHFGNWAANYFGITDGDHVNCHLYCSEHRAGAPVNQIYPFEEGGERLIAVVGQVRSNHICIPANVVGRHFHELGKERDTPLRLRRNADCVVEARDHRCQPE